MRSILIIADSSNRKGIYARNSAEEQIYSLRMGRVHDLRMKENERDVLKQNRAAREEGGSAVRRRSATRPRQRFFEEQLKGERALAFATAKRLYDLASQVSFVKPWRKMGDTDLILVKDPASREMCYCSVLGAAGQVFAIHAYCGIESFRFFKKIASGAPVTTGEYFAEQRGLTMELVPSAGLKGPDRELVRQLGHPLKKGYMAPQFRASRPGYQPWYLTEAEGKLLATCVNSVLAFCEYRESEPEDRFWNHEDVYPRVFWGQNGTFWVENVIARAKPAATPVAPRLDQARLAVLSKSDYPVRGIIELDEFYSGIPIGEENERKACLRVVLAADGETPFVYSVEAMSPGEARGDTLVHGTLKAIERHQFVPCEIRVKNEADQLLLAGLRERLGFELRVSELPNLERAKAELLQRLGDPGLIPG